ncbi:carbamoyltransferase N-terminal domain-containing protein [Planctomycetota bacterium]
MSTSSITILGLSCFYHDAAAAIVRDGQLIAAAAEERFTRKKHAHDFPINAINYCLKEAGIKANDLTYIVFYEKPIWKFVRILESYISTFPWSFRAFATAIPIWIKQKLRIDKIIRKELDYQGNLLFCDHHQSHAASAFLVSPFKEAAILTVDGVGEKTTTTYGIGRDNKIEIIKEIHFPHSVGLLYSAFTGYLGFKVNEGEGKVMGLAPYGEPVYMPQLDKMIKGAPDGSFRLNMKYFQYHYSAERMHNKAFCELLGAPARIPDSELTRHYKDVAASLQKKVEEVLVTIAGKLHEETGLTNLCIAGGVGLNSVANWEIRQRTAFKNIFIQPGAGDDGAAIGAAFFVWNCLLDKPRTFVLKHAFWGPGFSDEEIRDYLDEHKIRYEKLSDEELVERAAQLIADDKVVGWFRGRMEVGPGGLGARSIMGNPANLDMKDILNRKVKHREPFRPFAPSVAAEDCQNYFEMDCDSPFMLLVANVHSQWQEKLPAITHIDGTARVQTVTKTENGLYYDVCRKVGEKTGISVVIDTSFNIAGEPIVCTPHDAFHCYATTGIDRLVLGNYLLAAKNEAENTKAEAIEKHRMEVYRKKKEAANARMRHQTTLTTGKKYLFSIITILLIFLGMEFSLRFREKIKYGSWSTERMLNKGKPEPIYQRHRYTGVSLKPNSTLFDNKRGHIRINNLGFRGKDFTLAKPPGVFRVACIGGSTTFGIGASTSEKVWPQILEDLLREKYPGREFQVINAGVSGFTSAESLVNYALRVSVLEPDLVIIYHGYNDLKPNRYKGNEGVEFQSDYSHWRAPAPPQFRQDTSLLSRIGKHSMLLLKLRQEIKTSKRARKSKNIRTSDEDKFDTVLDAGVQAFKSNIRNIAAMAKSGGARVLIGTFVSRVNFNDPWEQQKEIGRDYQIYLPYLSIKGFADGIQKHNKALGDLADEMGAGLIDLATLFPKEVEYFASEQDHIHFSDKGNRLMSELCLQAIVDKQYIDGD